MNFDLAVTHERFGRVIGNPHQNGQITHPNDRDAPLLRLAASKKSRQIPRAVRRQLFHPVFFACRSVYLCQFELQLFASFLSAGSSGVSGRPRLLGPHRRASAAQPRQVTFSSRCIPQQHRQEQSGPYLAKAAALRVDRNFEIMAASLPPAVKLASSPPPPLQPPSPAPLSTWVAHKDMLTAAWRVVAALCSAYEITPSSNVRLVRGSCRSLIRPRQA